VSGSIALALLYPITHVFGQGYYFSVTNPGIANSGVNGGSGTLNYVELSAFSNVNLQYIQTVLQAQNPTQSYVLSINVDQAAPPPPPPAPKLPA